MASVSDRQVTKRRFSTKRAEPQTLEVDGNWLGDVPVAFSMCASPDGRHVAFGRMHVEVWDVTDQRKVATLDRHQSYISKLRYSPDGKRLLSAGGDKKIIVWNVDGYRYERTLLGSKGEVWGLDVSGDNRFALNASFGSEGGPQSVDVWPLSGNNPIENDNVPVGVRKNREVVLCDPDGRICGSMKGATTFEFNHSPEPFGMSVNYFPRAASRSTTASSWERRMEAFVSGI